MFSLESPHRGDSNEYTQHAIFNIKKKITQIIAPPPPQKKNNVCSYWIFSKGLKNEFETAMVNEPSVFEPLKFYSTYLTVNLVTTKFNQQSGELLLYIEYSSR